MKIFKSVNSNWKQYLYTFLLLQLLFILSTFWHEMGHYIPAKILGYSPTFKYSAVEIKGDIEKNDVVDSIYAKHSYEIINDIDFQGRDKYDDLRFDLTHYPFYISVGAPVLTLLTGLIVSFYLYFRRWKRRGTDWHFMDFLLVMLSLVFYRYAQYVFTFIMGYFMGDFPNIYEVPEAWLAFYFDIDPFIMLFAMGTLGSLFLFINFCLLVPLKRRLQFALICIASWIFADYFWINIVFEYLKGL